RHPYGLPNPATTPTSRSIRSAINAFLQVFVALPGLDEELPVQFGGDARVEGFVKCVRGLRGDAAEGECCDVEILGGVEWWVGECSEGFCGSRSGGCEEGIGMDDVSGGTADSFDCSSSDSSVRRIDSGIGSALFQASPPRHPPHKSSLTLFTAPSSTQSIAYQIRSNFTHTLNPLLTSILPRTRFGRRFEYSLINITPSKSLSPTETETDSAVDVEGHWDEGSSSRSNSDSGSGTESPPRAPSPSPSLPAESPPEYCGDGEESAGQEDEEERDDMFYDVCERDDSFERTSPPTSPAPSQVQQHNTTTPMVLELNVPPVTDLGRDKTTLVQLLMQRLGHPSVSSPSVENGAEWRFTKLPKCLVVLFKRDAPIVPTTVVIPTRSPHTTHTISHITQNQQSQYPTVHLPLELDLSSLLHHPSSLSHPAAPQKTFYNLHGFITHLPTSTSQHSSTKEEEEEANFIAYTRISGGPIWYRCDGEKVGEVELGVGGVESRGVVLGVYRVVS
ncbi:hypothetical protein HK097_007283, partial [Rhizophlyctis rosea]